MAASSLLVHSIPEEQPLEQPLEQPVSPPAGDEEHRVDGAQARHSHAGGARRGTQLSVQTIV